MPADFDAEALERRLVEASQGWGERLRAALIETRGEEDGNRLFGRFGRAVPTSYAELVDPRLAVPDITQLDRLTTAPTGAVSLSLYRRLEDRPDILRLKLFRRDTIVLLSDALPILENMGLKVLSEQPHEIRTADGGTYYLHDFQLRPLTPDGIDVDELREVFADAFVGVWTDAVENDGFNRLVLLARLTARDVTVLRAYCKYILQIGTPFSQAYIEQTLASNPELARLLAELFRVRFDPPITAGREERARALEEQLLAGLDRVQSLDEDRILRRYLGLIHATLRTNHFQTAADGQPKPYLSLKFASREVPGLPLPHPLYEISVYSPRFEAVHLRGGKVARGGLRWSDRREDFRTEVLGLMKAQMVKNSVIVPVGAKGGFVLKRPPAAGDRAALMEEGVRCYKIFLSGLLDITDNLTREGVVHPDRVVRYDDDDPYLVVAADKGTATFSDYANEVSQAYGFWLGDAFASGGSAGYDHKGMGITARGAWESVKRHFRELGLDPATDPFTVVGVGDMSGDVFGNGMLLSDRMKLVAAFDHRHIFIDPDPDPAASFKERQRLFALPRSSWADYDAGLISKGGGVYPRTAKRIDLGPEACRALGLESASLTPTELMTGILKAPVDLFWNGGIGTYVKAAAQTNAEAQDRANDAIRVDGESLRCRVVGEGGNLGCTQAGRIAYALKGGRINTDYVDNSAGVDCSDHEVNIKVLLQDVVAAGDMTLKQRDELLARMTDEVGELVLRDNVLQNLALSMTEAEGTDVVDAQIRLMRKLEGQGRLDRALEGLPADEVLQERRKGGRGLTRPEAAALLAYAKMTIYDDLLRTELPDRPYLAQEIGKYFPQGAAPALRRRDRRPPAAARDRRDLARQQHGQSRSGRLRLRAPGRDRHRPRGDHPRLRDRPRRLRTPALLVGRRGAAAHGPGRHPDQAPARRQAAAGPRCPLVPGPRQATVADGRGGHPLPARHRPDHGCAAVASGTGPGRGAGPRDRGMHRCRRAGRSLPDGGSALACSLGVRHRGGGRERRGGDGGCRGSPDAGGPCPLLPGRAARPRLARRCHRQGTAAQRLGPAGADPARGRAGRCPARPHPGGGEGRRRWHAGRHRGLGAGQPARPRPLPGGPGRAEGRP